MIEPEFINDESLLLIQNYEPDIDDSVYEDTQETSFNDDEIPSEQKLDIEINALGRAFRVEISPEERGQFRMSSGYLQVERSPGEYVSLTKSNGEFYAERTMRKSLGASLARGLLRIKTPTSVKTRSKVLRQEIPNETDMEALTSQQLEDVVKKVTRTIGINTDLDMREFLGTNKAFTRITGELKNNGSKLTEIDEHLEREHKKLEEIGDDPSYSEDLRDRIKKRIADLKEERSVRLEISIQNRKELSSQFSRMRQTIEKILDGDLPLRKKVKTIFREQEITITAVLTAFGLIISNIITSLTGGAAAGSPPKHPNKLKEWFKNKLKALARLLGRIAGKASAALPGIIGSIIAGVLNFLKKVVTTAADHVWIFLSSLATLVGYTIYQHSRKKRKN